MKITDEQIFKMTGRYPVKENNTTIINTKTKQTFKFKIPQTYDVKQKSSLPRMDVKIHIVANTIDKTIIKENLIAIFNSLLETFN